MKKKPAFISVIILSLTLGCGSSGDSVPAGVTESTDAFTVSSGAGLVYRIKKSSGDVDSIVWKGREIQERNRGSHLISGLGSAQVSRSISPSGSTVLITVETPTLTHYFATRRNENIIYMATYAAENPPIGELRWITRLQSSAFTQVPMPSQIANGTALESKDVFLVNGQTRSKYYGNEQARNLGVRGVQGPGIGVYMDYGNRESSSGGPFFRDIQNQSGQTTEVYNYMNSGHNQTEAHRVPVLHGPYALIFTDGPEPPRVQTDWMQALNLKGWVKSRGFVSGKISGIESGLSALLGFHSSVAQYWTQPAADGSYRSPAMKPGVYTQTLYQGELAVASRELTVAAGKELQGQTLASTWAQADVLWRIGRWDGTPLEFLNGPNFAQMHPSDTRNRPWIGEAMKPGEPAAQFPAAMWSAVNNRQLIRFPLAADQLTNRQLRIGLTAAFANGRPQIKINNWTSPIQPASPQPKSRSLTIGTYRGNNALYTYDIPASAFTAGDNTLEIFIVSGSSGDGFLSPGVSFDAIELLR